MRLIMKKKAVIIFLTSLLFGCKPQNILTEKVTTQTDNSSVMKLKDSLQIKNIEFSILQSDLQRAKEENISLRNETTRYEVNYDTNTPTDSITNRPAVIREVLTVNKSIYEESVREYKILLQEANIENINLSTRNSNLELSVENLLTENKTIKDEYKSHYILNFKKLVLITLIVLLLLLYIAGRIRYFNSD